MKYNLIIDMRNVEESVEFVNTNNTKLIEKWTVDKLMDDINRTIHMNLTRTEWINAVSCGGIVYSLSWDGDRTKKGYPIIEVEIMVRPYFGDSNYNTFKVRN